MSRNDRHLDVLELPGFPRANECLRFILGQMRIAGEPQSKLAGSSATWVVGAWLSVSTYHDMSL